MIEVDTELHGNVEETALHLGGEHLDALASFVTQVKAGVAFDQIDEPVRAVMDEILERYDGASTELGCRQLEELIQDKVRVLAETGGRGELVTLISGATALKVQIPEVLG